MMQGNDSFRLIVRRGPQPNQTFDLNKDIVTLGRDITNDIVINDPEVSRHHMRMTRGAGGYTLEDLGSTNGTFVNGQRLTGARPMRPGDMIGLGETVTLSYESFAPGAAMPAPGIEAAPVSPAAPAQRPPVVAPQYPQQQPQPQQQPYGSGYSPAPGYGAGQQGYGAQAPSVSPQPMPPQPGGGAYDYDPYAVREEEESRLTSRWVLIGCAGLSLFCCCSTVLGTVFVDQLCLWDRIPVVYQVLQALGYTMVCS